MAVVEIKHQLEDIDFFKSLRNSNVERDLTIEAKNGSVFVHKIVLKAYSPLIEKTPPKTKIKANNANIEDLLNIVNFCYEGRCVVQQERLNSLLELAKKMEFRTLQKMVEDIIEAQEEVGDALTICDCVDLGNEGSEEPQQQVAESSIDTSNQSANSSDKERCQTTSDNHRSKKKEVDSGNLTSNTKDEDKNATSKGVTRDLVAQPALQPKPHTPSHYNKWTKYQNETFLRLWLKYIREKASIANPKIRDELATIGLYVSNDNVYTRKRRFKQLYEQHLKGKHQPIIQDYLNQMARIYGIERNLANGVDPPESSTGNVNDDSTMACTSASLQSVKPHEFPEIDDESHIDHDLIPLNMVEVVMTEKGKFEGADMVYTDGNETVSSSGSVQVIDEPLESQYVAEFHEISDTNSDFADSTLFSENEMEQTASAQQGDMTTLKGFPRQRRFNRWTPKQNEIFLKYWLKRARNECKDATSRMRDELAKNGIQVKTNMIGARKQMFRKMYDGHLNGQNQPYILDYVKEMAMIYEAEGLNTESANGAPSCSTINNSTRNSSGGDRRDMPMTSGSRNEITDDGESDFDMFDDDEESLEFSSGNEIGQWFPEIQTGVRSEAASRADRGFSPDLTAKYSVKQESSAKYLRTPNQSYVRWTKQENDLFLDAWLRKLSTPETAIKDELAKNGLAMTQKNIDFRMEMFRNKYQNYMRGRNESYIQPYINQMAKIHKAESNLPLLSENSLSVFYAPHKGKRGRKPKNTNCEASIVQGTQDITPNEEYYSDMIDASVLGTEWDTDNEFDESDSADRMWYDDELSEPFTIGDTTRSKGLHRGTRSEASSSASGSLTSIKWTKEQNRIFLDLWLKNLRGANFKMSNELAKYGIYVQQTNADVRKSMFRKKYRKHLMGVPQPYIFDFVDQLEQIHEIESHVQNSSKQFTSSANIFPKTPTKAIASGSRVAVPTPKQVRPTNTIEQTDLIPQSGANVLDDIGGGPSRITIKIVNQCHAKQASGSLRHSSDTINPHGSLGRTMVYYNSGTKRQEDSSATDDNKRFKVHWTGKLNKIFLQYWLDTAQNQTPKGNKKLREVLAANGLRIHSKGIVDRKYYFRQKYQKHLDGFDEPYIRPYLELLKGICEAEMANTRSDSYADANERKWKSPHFLWSDEAIDVLLEVWLKYAKRGLHFRSWEMIANEVVDTLAQMNFNVTFEQVVSKKDQMVKKYREHIQGQFRPAILPHLPLLQEIHEALEDQS